MKRKYIDLLNSLKVTASTLVFTIIFSGCAQPLPQREAVPDWPTYGGNLQQTNSHNSTITPPLEIFWELDIDIPITTAAVAGNGLIYVAAEQFFYALDPQDGEVVWFYEASAPIRTSATLFRLDKDGPGCLAFSQENSHLLCFNAESGELIWEYHEPQLNQQGFSNPIFAAGRLYFTYSRPEAFRSIHRLAALNAHTGEPVWDTQTQMAIHTPLFAFESILGGTPGGTSPRFISHDASDGATEWVAFPEDINFAGVYSNFGVIDFDIQAGPARLYTSNGADPVDLRALNPVSGETLWALSLNQDFPTTGYALTQNRDFNHLIVSNLRGLCSIVPETGLIRWQRDIETKDQKPLIWGEYIFVALRIAGSPLQAIHLGTGEIAWTSAPMNLSTPPIIAGDSLIVGSSSGILYALREAQ